MSTFAPRTAPQSAMINGVPFKDQHWHLEWNQPSQVGLNIVTIFTPISKMTDILAAYLHTFNIFVGDVRGILCDRKNHKKTYFSTQK